MDIAIGILYSVLVLSFLVIIHELGHFFAAKFVKINTLEFGLGYPPLAKKLFRWWQTDFTLNWIPFGGFVRMQGEDEAKEKSEPGDFISASIPGRLLVVLAGATVNFVFGIVAYAILYSMTGIPVPVNDARIGYVFPNSPAAEAQLPTDWRITKITATNDSIEVASIEEAIAVISQYRGTSVDLVLQGPCESSCQTNYKTVEDVYVRTEQETPKGEGSVGIAFKDVALTFYPWWKMIGYSAWYGTMHALTMTQVIYQALGQLVSQVFTHGSVPQDISGPIGIVNQAIELDIFSDGVYGTLAFAAALSINLAVMNILPILPLDGGKAVMVILELFLSRKKVNQIELKLSQVGYFAFLGLIIVITIKDILQLR